MKQLEKRKLQQKSRKQRFCRVVAFFLLCFVFIFHQSNSNYLLRAPETSNRIDVVYTFVNGSNKEWLTLRRTVIEKMQDSNIDQIVSDNDKRFVEHNELKYSLRSIEKYGTFVNRIFIIVSSINQVPAWLDTSNSRIKIITHNDIFLDEYKNHLPTFNSAAIEVNLDNIKELSENFIYFNDDIFLGKELKVTDFIENGKQKIYLAWNMPPCAQNCYEEDLGNGICDMPCNTTLCNFDDGDCLGKHVEMADDLNYLFTVNTPCEIMGCLTSWLGDSFCDEACDNEFCAFDFGDCTDLSALSVDFSALIETDGAPFIVVELPTSWKEPYFIETNETSMYGSAVLPLGNSTYFVGLLGAIDLISYAIEVFFNDKMKFTIRFLSNFEDFYKLDDIDKEDDPSTTTFDSYGSALLHSKRILKQKLDIQPLSRVISHTPHFLSKSKLRQMKDIFEDEIFETSSHKFRNASDIQFAYLYYNFILSEYSSKLTDNVIFSYFDTDSNQDLNFNELKTLYLATLKDDNLAFEFRLQKDFESYSDNNQEKSKDAFKAEKKALLHFREDILSNSYYGQYLLFTSNSITLDDLSFKEFYKTSTSISKGLLLSNNFKTNHLTNLISNTLLKNYYDYELVIESEEISFVMMNDVDNIKPLDKLRLNPTKFICLNNDIELSNSNFSLDEDSANKQPLVEDIFLFQQLEIFYENMFPYPSSFEIISEYDKLLRNESYNVAVLWPTICLFLFCFLFLFLLLKRMNLAQISHLKKH